MTAQAAERMRALPGYAQNDTARRLVAECWPPEPVPAWQGLEDGPGFDAWVRSYARYVRRCFVRRDLPRPEEDPAGLFGRWLKYHETVCFAHGERGYGTIAARVQRALRDGRGVMVVSVDALAVHLVDGAIDHLNDQLGAEPTWSSHVFAPVPTLTSVCKAAVLLITGSLLDGHRAAAQNRPHVEGMGPADARPPTWRP